MPRPMLRKHQDNIFEANLSLDVNREHRINCQNMDKMQLDRIFRKKRSKKYMDAMHKLDVGGHVHNQAKVEEIIHALKEEFPEVEICGILLGYVSECYLGEPYEVHTLDMSHEIIEHYQEGQALPNGLEKARTLAMRGGYAFIEVYVDCCRAISSNGSVSVIEC